MLVWHSQAPEWFFHEDWNKDKPYASKEVMDARQEWYIQSVLNHFLGKDSPYKDMFYGWDVVNEAVSDSTGTYRKEDEKSSWWKAYGDQDLLSTPSVTPIIMRRKDWNSITMIIMNAQAIR